MTAQTQSNVPLLGPLEKVIATTVAVAIIIGIILLLLWRFVFLTIPAGHVGVLFSLLGGGHQEKVRLIQPCAIMRLEYR